MRKIIGVALAVALSVSCAPKQEKKAPPPKEVEVLKLSPSTVRETGDYLGYVISRQSVNVLPLVNGYVRKILVRPGDKVTAGQVLIQVDPRQESAALQSTEAQLLSAKTNADLAQQTLSRTQALYKEGLVSAQELERAQASARAATAAMEASRAQVSQRRVQLQYYGVEAPFSGTVGDVLVRLGDFVTASTVMTSLAQAEVLEVGVSVPAERARQVKQDTVLEILDSKSQTLLSTKVYFVAPQADPRTQLVDVKAVFENTVGLRPSELVRARLVYSTREALQIPALAVVRQSGQAFAFKVHEKDGKTAVAKTPITLGPLGATSYVVEKGLSEGDQVVTSSLQALRDGMTIKVKPSRAAAPAQGTQVVGQTDATRGAPSESNGQARSARASGQD